MYTIQLYKKEITGKKKIETRRLLYQREVIETIKEEESKCTKISIEIN